MNAEQLNQYGLRLNHEIMTHFTRDFLLCKERDKWFWKVESSMRNFVLSRPGWIQDKEIDELFIFKGEYPIIVNYLYCAGAGMVMVSTAINIAKAELINELSKNGCSLEENINTIIKCIEDQNWLLCFIPNEAEWLATYG